LKDMEQLIKEYGLVIFCSRRQMTPNARELCEGFHQSDEAQEYRSVGL